MKRCVDCNGPIGEGAVLVALGESMSGARESVYAHPDGSPDCKPAPLTRGRRIRAAMATDRRQPK